MEFALIHTVAVAQERHGINLDGGRNAVCGSHFHFVVPPHPIVHGKGQRLIDRRRPIVYSLRLPFNGNEETTMPEKNGYAAIWDVDGTLVDTAEMHFDAW